ncbi:hypothetical protein CEB3_c13820 [Peptococcaceae bacterium CEB3]|nr:hypothetical protein CEB3_c13820 [Peptococcaceae bacterium CEB3]
MFKEMQWAVVKETCVCGAYYTVWHVGLPGGYELGDGDEYIVIPAM